MRSSRRISASLTSSIIILSLACAASAQQRATTNAAAQRQFALSQLGTFIENKGQWDSHVKYLASSNGVDSWVTKDGVVYDFYKLVATAAHPKSMPAIKRQGDLVKVTFAGSNTSNVKPGPELPGKLNYMIGNDRSKWAIGVRRFAEARTENIYPGVSARYYFDKGVPRYDLVVAPGTDPSKIQMHFDGAQSVSMSPTGTLAIKTSVGTIEEKGLYAYQGEGFMKTPVACKMVADGKTVAFRVAKYDRSKALVIDPLIFSTFLGGSNGAGCNALALDSSHNVVVAGTTYSTNFPTTTGVYQHTDSATGGAASGFVASLSSDGTTLNYGTYLGGSANTSINAMKLDSNGNVVVAGNTNASDFPTSAGAFQTTNHAAGTYHLTGFVASLSSDGTTLNFGTYLGGTNADQLNAIGVDSSNNAVVGGQTESSDFPVTGGAYQTSNHGSSGSTATLAKISSDGTSEVAGSYFGGGYDDGILALAVDSSNNVFVCGDSASNNLPTTTAAYQATNKAYPNTTGFVSELNSGLTTLVSSTYLGGTNLDSCLAITLDASGNPVVAGQTQSTNFPTTAGAPQTSNSASAYTGFVSKMSSDGKTLMSSTYLGGSHQDYPVAVAVDTTGNIIVAGVASSSDFPVTAGAYQTALGGASADGFVSKLNSAETSLIYSTYLGGDTSGSCTAITLDSSGNPVVGGNTSATDFPTTSGAYSRTNSGGNGFITDLSMVADTVSSFSVNPTAVIGGNSTTATLAISSVAGPYGQTVAIDAGGNAGVTGPSSATVPFGNSSVTFSVTTTYVSSQTVATITATLGSSSMSASLTIDPATITGVSMSPTAVIGGTSSTGTITLNTHAGPTGDAVTINAPSPASVTSPVTVPAGTSTTTFTVNTSAVSVANLVIISCTQNSTTKQATLTVNPATLTNFTLASGSVVGGTNASGTITLGSAAGPSGDTATLSTTPSSPAVTPPASAIVASGTTTKTFSIPTAAVATSTTVAVKATWNGVTLSQNLTVTPPAVSAFSVSPTAIYAGQTSTGTLTLSGTSAGDSVSMTRSAVGATSPVTVTVPSGMTSTTFTLTGSAVATTTNVVFTATFNSTNKQATLTVYPFPALTAFTVSNTNPVMTAGVTGTITMNEPVPINTTLNVVDSSDGRIAIDTQPVVLAGHSTTTFPLHAVQIPNVSVGLKNIKSSTVTASYNGVNVDAVLSVSTFGASSPSLSKTTIHAGQSTTLTINSAHFAGVVPLLVNLTTSNSTLASVPATVNIPIGATSTTVTITAPAHVVGTNTVNLTVTISSAPIQTITLTVEP